ncbi:MAG: hypothetical protein IJW45_08965 [Oscillospiraceae bacterium]|nr:hypothetical protein [Oscillospiraceae bacterium]
MDQRRKELPPLVRCLTFLFWLTIATSVISLLANEMFFPEYRVQLVFLSAISMFAYSLVLLALSKICDGYRIAGVCGLVFTALDLIADLNEGIELVWIFLLAAAIFGFFMEYQEYLAHADAVEEYDSAVAEQWRSLWLWKLWVTIASIASVFLALFTQFLAAMVLFAATIAGIIISVIHMVYLYRTARVCRNYLSASEG